MKKLAFLLAVFAFGYTNAQAPLEKGSCQLNAGVGTSGWGVPVYVGLDYGIAQDVTLGGELSYQSYNRTVSNFKVNSSIIGFQGNCNYHFNSLLQMRSEWDLYAGASLNYFSWNTNKDGLGNGYSDPNGLELGLQIGSRYFFNEKFAVNLQIGGGNAVGGIKVGVTLKL